MSVSCNPDITTENLILYYDAGNPRSYQGTGNIWKNIQQDTLNGTLNNSPAYTSGISGYFSFDGTDDNVNVGNLGINFYCANIWFYLNNEVTSNSATMGFLKVHSSSQGGWNFGSVTGFIPDETFTFLYYNGSNYTRTALTESISAGWHNVCINWNGSKYDVYLDNINKITTSGTVGDVPLISLNNLILGASYGGAGPYFSGRIANISIYSDSLTADQIGYNFVALRGRYGI